MTGPLEELAATAQQELERALRGASLCAVSRDPSAATASVKFLEGRWYALQDVRRRLAAEPALTLTEVADQVAADGRRRTPAGPAWTEYAAGAASALDDVRAIGTSIGY